MKRGGYFHLTRGIFILFLKDLEVGSKACKTRKRNAINSVTFCGKGARGSQ